MKTEELISLLAGGVTPVERGLLFRRFGLAVILALSGSTVMMLLIFGIRPDLVAVAHTPLFWGKVAFPLCLGVGALWMITRLARPGMTCGAGRWLVMAGVLAVWAGALFALAQAAPDARLSLVFGKTWKVCAFNIVLLSVPGFAAIFWALRGMAPTRLGLAGACGGLLAGSLATIAYCLHCPEMEIPFWGVWYLLGLLLSSVLGGLLGPRVLRW
ncbi:DUF1109 domain-containing protein [Pseudomonas sp. GD03842]|uniref:DUF1109 domain-containing protein n=1 Tax=unclassified Pseudomonas TaxID=196821 RepID=UPI000D37F156|nr:MULTISPECIES: DUF1109 domain-containing protein [unclassified Pseudomonas]MDH0746453.1 DUF1109 domain-containing protein [Pseudomonas sp. GD03842]RAU46530.1 DUF1109 domain-containing protein [Pseudomonas sp. RIT 409]RAU52457.1 DUF1109 domain-containing protein [Pseudomonas sp. RIT 412]